MGGKLVVSVISVLLVVGIVIGVVVVIHHNGNTNKDTNSGKQVSSKMKKVDAICALTSFKEACVASLGPVAQNESAAPHDYVRAGVKLAVDQLDRVYNLTETLKSRVNGTKNPNRSKMAIESCQDLYDIALDRLDAAMANVTDIEVFKNEERVMQDNVRNTTQLTTNLLDTVTTFNEFLARNDFDEFELVSGGPHHPSSRRLLGTRIDADGLPAWLSDLDRRLMGEKKHKNKKAKVVAGAIIPGPPPGSKPAPNAVVPDQFKTINDALASYPSGGAHERFVIYIKGGTCKEDIIVTKKQPNVFIYGDGPRKTVITGSKSFKSGFQTSKTAPFNIEGQNFFTRDIGFQNTAGPEGHQACAIRINALQSVFQNCWFDGFQDTLYVQGGSQFFRDCEITGTVDSIFGNGATLIQNCKIVVKKGGSGQQNMVTAQGGVAANEPTGLVIQGGEILPDPQYYSVRFQMKTYLGRPWKAYAKTVFMEVMIGDLVDPEGYFPWAGTQNLDMCFYGEYLNRGPGSDSSRRVNWKNVRVLTKDDARWYSAGVFLGGAPWVKAAGVPVGLDVT